MSYRSKRAISVMITSTLVLIAFVVYALGESAPAVDDLKAWALAMLIFIGIAVVAQIIIQIVFHIITSIGIAIIEGEENAERILESDMVEDERDKQISRKSSNASSVAVGVGFLASLALIALGFETSLALCLIFASFFIASLVDGFMNVYLTERGL